MVAGSLEFLHGRCGMRLQLSASSVLLEGVANNSVNISHLILLSHLTHSASAVTPDETYTARNGIVAPS